MNWGDVPNPNVSVWWGQTWNLSKHLETDDSPLRRSAVALGYFAETLPATGLMVAKIMIHSGFVKIT